MSAAAVPETRPEHDEFWSVWTREEVIDAIFHAPETCRVSDFDFGASTDDWHRSPDDFDLDDLVDMFIYDEDGCPLHVKASYPYACNGEVARQFAHAHDRLVEHTRRHTGAVTVLRGDDGVWRYHATPDELRAVWEAFPHARHVFEHYADAGDLTIHVED